MKRMIMGFWILLLFLPKIYAQTPKPDTLEYRYPGEVVISASRMNSTLKETPISSTVVDSVILNTLPRSVGIDEPLKLVPGVKVDNQADGERVHMSVRGQGILTETGIRSIKILLDGLPMNDPSGFAPDFFDVDLNAVDRMEVLRGPAASLYGGGAAGGIINILTQNSPNRSLFGDISTTAGSNGFWKGFGQLGGDVNDVNYRVSLSRTGGDGYRVHTHFWENSVYAKAIYTPQSNIEITPIFSWSDTYHENPEGLSLQQYLKDPTLPNDDAVPYNEHMEMNRTTQGITGVVRFLEDHEIRFNAYIKESEYVEANNHVFDHQALTTPGTSIQYTYRSGMPDDNVRNKLSVGTDLQWQTNNERLQPNSYGFEENSILARQRIWQWGTGAFLIDILNLGTDWSFMGSVRYDKTHNELTDEMKTDTTDNSGSAEFSDASGRLGLTYSPTRDLTIYGSWGEGFTPPSTEELGSNPNGYGGFNPNLKAATSECFELGARGLLGRTFEFEATGFTMSTTNDFDRYRIPGRGNGEEGTFYKNIGASKRYGLELSATAKPVSQLALQLAYTYSHFTYDIGLPIPILMDDSSDHRAILDGNWLPNSPQHQLMIDLRYDVTPELSLGVTSETYSESFIDGANVESEAAPGYTLLGGRIVYRWQTAGISGDLILTAKNIGDKTYVAFTEPDSGGNSYQPGSGREIFGGIRIHL